MASESSNRSKWIENFPVWIDIIDGINEKDTLHISNGINVKIIAVLCFLIPMYQASKQCQQEVEFAKSVKIPIIGCCLFPNWKPSGWLNQMINDRFTIDLRGINAKNFHKKISPLQEKLIQLLTKISKCERTNQPPTDPSLADGSILFSLIENDNLDCVKKKLLKYRMIPRNCRSNLSNIMICNNEYILILGNNYLHLFDRNLKHVRSNEEIKINEKDLRDLNWCADLNQFLILTKKQIYLMNPLTSQIFPIENIKLTDQREEFISSCFSQEKFFLITLNLKSNSFYLQSYQLPRFRFLKKYSILHLMGPSLFIQNGFFNKSNIQQIISIRFYQNTLLIIMDISSQWFIYVFNLYEESVFLQKIPLDEKSRITILSPINQWILFKDNLSNSFLQMSIDLQNISKSNQLDNYTKGFIDFNGKLRSVALFGTSNLVLLIENALVIYQL